MALRNILFCLIVLVCGFLPGVASADTEPIILTPKSSELIDLKADTLHLIDPTRALSLEDVRARSDAFQPIESAYIDFGLGDFRVWLKATLYNPGEAPGIWRLDTGRPFMEELDIYLVREGLPPEHVLIHRVADTFNKRPQDKRTLTVDLTIPEEEIVELYIAFRSSSTTSLAIDFGAPVAVSDAKHRETLIDMSLNSGLLAMLALALMFIWVTGWRLSLAFAAYIISGMLYVAHADGYTAQYLWPDIPISNDAINLILMLFMSASGINFGRVLFVFRDTMPRYDRFLAGFSLLALGFSVIAYPLINITWLMVLAYVMVPLGTLIQPMTGLIAMRANYAGAIPFLCGALLVLVAILYSVVAHIFPGQFDLDQTLDVGHIALLGETFAFAGAIVVRLLGLQKERDAAMGAELVAVNEKLAMSSALRESQQQYLEARELSRQRSEHLSSVSHDLQQPLTSLRAVISKMAVTNDDVGNQMHSALDYLETLARDQMKPDDSGMINAQSDGLLDVFPVSVILNNAYEMFRSEAGDKGLELRLRSLDHQVQADAVSLMRVVSNLVKNAIRHTASGDILLAARSSGDNVLIEVYDTGPGISEADLSRLMRRHEKGEASDGDGLGLSIVQQLSAHFDWKFDLASTLGRGTRARIYIPRHT